MTKRSEMSQGMQLIAEEIAHMVNQRYEKQEKNSSKSWNNRAIQALEDLETELAKMDGEDHPFFDWLIDFESSSDFDAVFMGPLREHLWRYGFQNEVEIDGEQFLADLLNVEREDLIGFLTGKNDENEDEDESEEMDEDEDEDEDL